MATTLAAKNEVIEYLKDSQENYAYEHEAMSKADFSKFLMGLLELLEGKED